MLGPTLVWSPRFQLVPALPWSLPPSGPGWASLVPVGACVQGTRGENVQGRPSPACSSCALLLVLLPPWARGCAWVNRCCWGALPASGPALSARQVWVARMVWRWGAPHPPRLPFWGRPAANTHQLSLVAEAEGADLFGLRVLAVAGGGRGRRRRRAARARRVEEGGPRVAGLPVAAGLTHQQHVAQVRDVAGGQAQGLDLGELAVGRLGGDERAQRREGRVHAVRPVPLARVRRVPLSGLAARPPPRPRASAPRPPAPGPSPGALEAAARRVHAAGLLVGARTLAAAVLVLRQRAHLGVQVAAGRCRAQHRERHGAGGRRQLRRAPCMPPPPPPRPGGRGVSGLPRWRLRRRAHVCVPGWSRAAGRAFIAEAAPPPRRPALLPASQPLEAAWSRGPPSLCLLAPR